MSFEIAAFVGRGNLYNGSLLDANGGPRVLAAGETLQFSAWVEGSPPGSLFPLTNTPTAGSSQLFLITPGDTTTNPVTPAKYVLVLNPDVLAGVLATNQLAEVLQAEYQIVETSTVLTTADRGVLHVLGD